MNKSKLLRPLPLALFLGCCLGYANAAPYGPDGRATRWIQPTGEVLNLRVFGDDYYGRTETTDGYTVVYDSTDGAYHYAGIASDGSALIPSGPKVSGKAPANLTKRLDLSKEVISKLWKQRNALINGERLKRWNERVDAAKKLRAASKLADPEVRSTLSASLKAKAAPVVGDKKGLTILVQFPNDSSTSSNDTVNFPTTQSKIERFCNLEGYQDNGNTGSVRDYYFDQSGGKLTYTQSVTQVITMPKARNYYNFADYPANRNFRNDASRVLITDAINVLKAAGYDFSSLSTDADGNVEATNVFFAGQDSGSYAQGLWPQQWSLAVPMNVGTSSTPMYINAFQITNIPDAAPVIGTFCHENGHLILGYPDIYASEPGEGEGVGEHCLMGSGNYLNDGKTPSPINAHFKDLVGWENMTVISPTDILTAKLPTTGNVAYRIFDPTLPDESFVVENRGAGDRWAADSDDKGIVIWHIDDSIDGNNGRPAHYQVSVEQADGRSDLENGTNRGDNGDYFDRVTPKFKDTTTPNSNWWNGAKSKVDVNVLSEPGKDMTVAFGGVLPDTIIVTSPNSGEVIYPVSNFRVTWDSNIVGNVKIELLKGGVAKSVISANEASDGVYDWKVPAGLAAGTDYAIKISSLTNKVPASDVSDVAFSVSDATFPASGDMPYGWVSSGSGKAAWSATSSTVYEGKKSLVSGKIRDGATSSLSYTSNFLSGTVSFYIKVSSEAGFDLARFYIDGVAQVIDVRGGTKLLSGDIDWTFVSFPLSAGKHTLKWTYVKDDSFGDLKDSVWVDGLLLPATTQEIAVEQPIGTDLVSGTAAVAFEPTRTGYISTARTFTIRNVGTADLVGLSLALAGTNPGDFSAGGLGKTVLAPGQSTTFNVTFNPAAIRESSAIVRIASNDVDESKFAISLSGAGLAAPLINVNQGAVKLTDNTGTTDYGSIKIGSVNTKTFTISNKGAGTLGLLAASVDGTGSKLFTVESLKVNSLAPGESTSFNVTFSPAAASAAKAALHISSDDTKSGVFDINLTGKGVKATKSSPEQLAANAITTASGSASPPLVTSASVEVIGGSKYRSLTIIKQPGVEVTGTVEVSPNLLDWFSGKKHTTVMVDDATTLKVRDNTPVSSGVKRYIRLK